MHITRTMYTVTNSCIVRCVLIVVVIVVDKEVIRSLAGKDSSAAHSEHDGGASAGGTAIAFANSGPSMAAYVDAATLGTPGDGGDIVKCDHPSD